MRGKRITAAGAIGIGAVVLGLVALAVWGFSGMRQSGASPHRTVPLEKGELVLTVPATGVVEPVFSVEIKSKASGEILKVLVEEGDRVEKGDILIEIDPRIEEIGVRRAEADLMVAEAGVRKAEILLEKARLNRLRKDRLHEKGVVADQEKEEAHQEEGLQEADLALARAQLLRVRETLSEAKERLQHTRVISPISGVVLSLYVQPGQIISSGTSSFSQGTLIAILGDLSRLQIRAEVDETDTRMVVPGQEARVSLDAFPGQIFRARVKRVAPGAWMKNDLAIVEILLTLEDIKGDSSSLRPGLSANVEIVTQRLSDALLLPREAVRLEGGEWGVSVVQGESAAFRKVTVGASDGNWMQILTDLPEGTRIMVGGGPEGRPPVRGRPGRVMP